MTNKIGYACGIVAQKEIVLNLSEKCNNFCLSCPNDENFRKDVIKQEKVIDFIKKKVTKDIDRITFIGGEPTILKNLNFIIEYIRSLNKKAIIQINTNGRMFFYEEFTNKFLKFDKNKLEFHIALYDSNAKTHDKITQIKGSFNQTVQGIKNLLDLGFEIYVRIIVSKLNFVNLPKFARFIIIEFNKQRKSVNKVVIVGMDIIGNAYRNRHKLAVSHLTIAPYIERCIDELLAHNMPVEVHLLPKGIFKKEYHSFVVKSGCVGGEFVDSYGCKECSYNQACCKLLRSYTKIFGNKEHTPCITMKKKSLIEKIVLQNIPLALNEIIGVKYDFKPLMMADQVSYNDLIKKLCHEEGLKFENFDMGNFLKIFISKDRNGAVLIKFDKID